MIRHEEILHQQVCDYLKLRYPGIIFRSNHEDGRKRHPREQARIKRLNSGRAYPDLFVAEPIKGFSGLFIELKAKPIYTKGGMLKKDEHLHEQSEMLVRLRSKGYQAKFAVGFEEARSVIDNYFGREVVAKAKDDTLF